MRFCISSFLDNTAHGFTLSSLGHGRENVANRFRKLSSHPFIGQYSAGDGYVPTRACNLFHESTTFGSPPDLVGPSLLYPSTNPRLFHAFNAFYRPSCGAKTRSSGEGPNPHKGRSRPWELLLIRRTDSLFSHCPLIQFPNPNDQIHCLSKNINFPASAHQWNPSSTISFDFAIPSSFLPSPTPPSCALPATPHSFTNRIHPTLASMDTYAEFTFLLNEPEGLHTSSGEPFDTNAHSTERFGVLVDAETAGAGLSCSLCVIC